MSSFNAFDLSKSDIDILGFVPGRWERMDLVSKKTVIEVGKVLLAKGLIVSRQSSFSASLSVGLIGGSRFGSLPSDLFYVSDKKKNNQIASPALFCYTLPNIPLAEAAVHYNLVGPVFALISKTPYYTAVLTANQWLTSCPSLKGFIAGEVASKLDEINDTAKVKINFVERPNENLRTRKWKTSNRK